MEDNIVEVKDAAAVQTKIVTDDETGEKSLELTLLYGGTAKAFARMDKESATLVAKAIENKLGEF